MDIEIYSVTVLKYRNGYYILIYIRGVNKVSNDFNENLSMFLTSCREFALQQLKENNSAYKQLSDKATDLSIRIKNELPDQHEILIEQLLDIYHALFGMEINYLYLQGFKDCINLYKRFDSSFSESRDLEAIFL